MSTLDQATYALQKGAEFPYDAAYPGGFLYGVDPTPPPASDWAHAAARGVAFYVETKKGIRISSGIAVNKSARTELVNVIATIIRLAADHDITILRNRDAENQARIAELCEHFAWLSEQVRALVPGASAAAELKATEAKP